MAIGQAAPPPVSAAREGTATLLLIAAFKLLKGVLLLCVGFGALHLLHRDVAATVMHWVNLLRVDPDNRFIHRLLTHILAVKPGQLRELSAGTFIYAALLLTEGVGLLLKKSWAEYFTIITTAGLIPLELYEIFHRVTAGKILVLIINVAIVVYLILRVLRERRQSAARPAVA